MLDYITALTAAVVSVNRRADELATVAAFLGGRRGDLMRADADRYRTGVVGVQNELASAIGAFMRTYGKAP